MAHLHIIIKRMDANDIDAGMLFYKNIVSYTNVATETFS